MKPLNQRELNMVINAIDSWSGVLRGGLVTTHTCLHLDAAYWAQRDSLGKDVSPLRIRYAKFFDQTESGQWPLGYWDDNAMGERAMLLATFLVLKGVVPGEEA